MKLLGLVACLALLFSANGCRTTLQGTDARTAPEVPEISLPDTWSRSADSPGQNTTPLSSWWTNFADQVMLDRLSLALENPDVEIARARLRKAFAGRNTQISDWQPRASLDTRGLFGLELDDADLDDWDAFQWNGSFDWEFDLWGQGSAAKEAASAQIDAARFELHAIRLAAAVEPAATDIQLRTLREQRDITQRATEIASRFALLYEKEREAGRADRAKVLRQESEVALLERRGLEIERNHRVLQHRLAGLCGQFPNVETSEPEAQAKLENLTPSALELGLPADLLLRRPDLRMALARAEAAGYDAIAAEKSLLPKISLVSRGKSARDPLNQLIKSFTLGFGPSIELPLLDPSLNAKREVADAEVDVVKAMLRASVLQGLIEVEDALANLANLELQAVHLQASVDRLRSVRELNQKKFNQGLVSQVEILDVERDVLQAESDALTVRRDVLLNHLALYKALGGGWQVDGDSHE